MEKNTPVIDQTLFDLKLNEAQFYSDQGLYDEADKIYLNLINELKKMPETKSSAIQIRQLELIRQEYQKEIYNGKSVVESFHEPKVYSDKVEPKIDIDSNVNSNTNYSDKDTDDKIDIFFNDMIIEAYQRNASDIHIEPSLKLNFSISSSSSDSDTLKTEQPLKVNNQANIRFRIDGICQQYANISNKFALALIFKIKLMANIDIKIRAKHQYGKIKFKSNQTDILELKITTIPTLGSKEDLVISFFPVVKLLKLKDIGFIDHHLKTFVEMLAKPSGLILVAGDSKSEKTTTLHSALEQINSPEKKIWCVENQVKIIQKGIRYVEISPDKELDYPQFLKSFIATDSDIIMVEELMDYDTTSLAIKASITGNLVIAGVYAESAYETLRVILEKGINPVDFSNCLKCILVQKNVKRLCEKCKKPSYKFEQLKNKEYSNILEMLIDEFFVDPIELISKTDRDSIIIYEHSPEGCEHCGYTGYKGKIALHELLINTDHIKSIIKDTYKDIYNKVKIDFKAIVNTVHTIKSISGKHGYYNYIQDGILKVMEGAIDMAEVRRNC